MPNIGKCPFYYFVLQEEIYFLFVIGLRRDKKQSGIFWNYNGSRNFFLAAKRLRCGNIVRAGVDFMVCILQLEL
jgi:hypothetical protein